MLISWFGDERMNFDRRHFLGATLAAARAGPTRAGPASAGTKRRIVRVEGGLLAGTEQDGVFLLKGVPFAAPPVGPLRFRPPQPVARWRGVRDASRFALAPVQADPPMGRSALDYLGAERGEDCLYLNIWAPAAPGPHPVFVWIHGGGNEGGAASAPPADGASFARSGVICITVAYRTGILGFLELGELLGPDYRGSAANGLKDIIAALQWVRRNISSLGGDPARVTVGGESAGGKNVCALIACPAAKGLFSAAIVQSGGETIHDRARAHAVAALAGAAIREGGGRERDLLTMPPERIVALQAEIKQRFDRPFPFRAVVDGTFLPQNPIAAISAGSAAGIRLLIGTNRDESILFVRPQMVDKPLVQAELTNMDVADAQPVFERYRAAYPALSPLQLRVRFLTAEEYWLPSMRIALGQSASATAPVYAYRFDLAAAGGPFAGWAAHVSEMPYMWNQLDHPAMAGFIGRPDAQRRAVAAQMHARWVSFIRGGAPDAAEALDWPDFRKDEALLVIDGSSRVAKLDRAELALWADADHIISMRCPIRASSPDQVVSSAPRARGATVTECLMTS